MLWKFGDIGPNMAVGQRCDGLPNYISSAPRSEEPLLRSLAEDCSRVRCSLTHDFAPASAASMKRAE